MATTNITNRYVNPNKRYAESVVVSLPSQLESAGARTGSDPVYAVYGDSYVASVVEPNSILKKIYIVIDQVFPAGSLIAVQIGVTTVLTAIDATTLGLTASATEDLLVTEGTTVTITVTGGTVGDDITTGLAKVVLDVDSLDIKNGNYSINPV